jgi:hypothetical protein
MSTNIIVKVKYADDIRKAALPLSEVNTFTAMANWIAETYNIDGSHSLMLKYKDEDGDMITMINDDDLQLALTSQQKLYIHAFVCEESSAASNNGSRRASPTKTESVAVIHPTSHEEKHLSSPESVTSSQQREQHFRHLQQSPSQSNREDSASTNGMRSQGHQQHPPSCSVNPQSYDPSQHHQQQSYSGLPPPLPTQQQQRQLQQQQSYSSIPAPYNHREQQQLPSYPPQSAPPQQQYPPSSMNGMAPLQQQQPSYPPQQSFAQLSMNGMPPQQQQPSAPHSGIQQVAPPPMNGMPPLPPSSQHQQSYQLQQPSYPPTQQFGTRPGLGNPFARQQHPGQR